MHKPSDSRAGAPRGQVRPAGRCAPSAGAPRRQVRPVGRSAPSVGARAGAPPLAPRRPAARTTERPSQSSRLPRESRKWPGEGGQARTGGTSGSGSGGGPGPQVSGGRAGRGGGRRAVCAPPAEAPPVPAPPPPGLAVPPLADAGGPPVEGVGHGGPRGSPPRDLPDGDLPGFPLSLCGVCCAPGRAAAPDGGPGGEGPPRLRAPGSRGGPAPVLWAEPRPLTPRPGPAPGPAPPRRSPLAAGRAPSRCTRLPCPWSLPASASVYK